MEAILNKSERQDTFYMVYARCGCDLEGAKDEDDDARVDKRLPHVQ